MKPLFWHRCECTPTSPSPREGHTLTYSSAVNCYLLYGGIGSQRFKEVSAFSTVTKSWEEITTSGKPPPERNGHVAWIDEENQVMYVHGGQSTKREAMADLYALQLETGSWSRVTLAEEQPEERTNHSVATIANRAFIFGGSSPVTPFMKDLWSFNFGALDWSQGRLNGQGWTRHTTRGQGPAPRKAHSMVSFEGKLYIFGGITEQGYVNDMYAVNTLDFKFYKVNAKGAVPTPRAYHSVTVMENGFMAMFGGLESHWDGKTEKLNLLGDFYILNLHDMRWSLQTLPPGGTVPSRRYGHALAWGYGQEAGQIVLLGGIDRTHCPMDVYWLEETRLAPGQAWQVQELESREKASAMQTENTITLQRQKLQEMERQLHLSNQRM